MSIASPDLPSILGLLDVGTSKVVCLVLARCHNAAYAVAGLGHQRSRGLKASVIVDADAAEDAIRATIAQAEHMAGTRIEDVVIAAACGRLTSTHLAAGLDLHGRAVTANDMDRLLHAGRSHAERDDHIALHVNHLGIRIDGNAVGHDSIGRAGRRLEVDVHALSADCAPIRNLLHVIERCQLRTAAILPAPLASALAVTTAEDRHRGVTVIDFGAGTTSLAVFSGGYPAAAHVIPIGSNHVTYDLMRALGTSIAEAERIKKKCATLIVAHPAAEAPVPYLSAGDDHASSKQATRADITTILTSRIDALLRQISERLHQAAIPSRSCGDLVLTGGGSLLDGLAERASTILGRPARLAAFLTSGFMPAAVLQPAFATVIGLESMTRDRRLGLRLYPNNTMIAASSAKQAWQRLGF